MLKQLISHQEKFVSSQKSYEDAVRKHEYIKKHDEMKNAFCKDNSINLIRIPYYEFEDLEYYLFDKFTSIGIISEIKSN